MESTNIILRFKQGWKKSGKKWKEIVFISEEHLDELHDLIHDYKELKSKNKI